ncbi:UNVERIFIED_CONTAM: hypothetical protein K2H54_004375 [Gekko kuhli]
MKLMAIFLITILLVAALAKKEEIPDEEEEEEDDLIGKGEKWIHKKLDKTKVFVSRKAKPMKGNRNGKKKGKGKGKRETEDSANEILLRPMP